MKTLNFILHFLTLSFSISIDLPGTDLLASGYDGVKLEPRSTIFEMDSDHKKTIFLQSKEYELPSEISSHFLSEKRENSYENVYSYFAEVYYKYTETINFNIGLKTENFSLGIFYHKQLDQLYHSITTKDQSIGLSEVWWSMYSLNNPPAFILNQNPRFKRSIEFLDKNVRIPQKEQDQFFYNQIIEAYGTHFCSSVIMALRLQPIYFLTILITTVHLWKHSKRS